MTTNNLPLTENPNQALREKGDFTAIAAIRRESGESLGVSGLISALDLGCGDGTTALPLARRGAHVRGIDIARNLVAADRHRAEAAGLDDCLSFKPGAVCCLANGADESADLTLTVFGAMFAPQPSDVARELVRVTMPAGADRHGQLDLRGRHVVRLPATSHQSVLRATASGQVRQLQGMVLDLAKAQTVSTKAGIAVPATSLRVIVQC